MRKIRYVLRLLRWWTKQVPVVIHARSEPRTGRWHLLSLDVPAGLGARWRLWPRLAPREFSLNLDGGRIFFSGQAINGDRGVFGEIFVADAYRTDYENAIVVDVGAHKGYFGAYALLHGARTVLSYEPERANFRLLEQAADSFRANGFEWHTFMAAVSSSEGEADLKVSRESWTHSIVQVEKRDETERAQRVRLVPITHVLEEALHLNGRVILKIDAEGAECEIVFGAPPELWAEVAESFVEVHEFAACSAAEMIQHVGMPVVERGGLLHFSRVSG